MFCRLNWIKLVSDGGEARCLHQHPKSKSDIGEHDQTS
jgi:hypothetical protein